MPLTQHEIDFLTGFILEDFNHGSPSPKHQALADMGFTRAEWAKLFEFKFQWQEQAQIEIFDCATSEYHSISRRTRSWRFTSDVSPPLGRDSSWRACSWTSRGTTPPNVIVKSLQGRQAFWSDFGITPFTTQEADFLDALYGEISTHFYGPCLRSIVDRQIYHFHLLELVGRRAIELLDRGLTFPQSSRSSDTVCPWSDQQEFDARLLRLKSPPRSEEIS